MLQTKLCLSLQVELLIFGGDSILTNNDGSCKDVHQQGDGNTVFSQLKVIRLSNHDVFCGVHPQCEPTEWTTSDLIVCQGVRGQMLVTYNVKVIIMLYTSFNFPSPASQACHQAKRKSTNIIDTHLDCQI